MLREAAPRWLHALVEHAEAYAREVLGLRLIFERQEPMPQLPRFLTDRFQFVAASLEGRPLLFMAHSPRHEQTPANITRMLTEASRRLGQPVVYLTDAIAGFNRRRLMDQRVPFLVPYNQLFIPQHLLDLRETFANTLKPQTVNHVSPTTQKVLLASLFGVPIEHVSASELARSLGNSPMAIARAFDELRTAKLAKVEEAGREKKIRLVARGQDLWNLALPRLRSPVRKRRRVKRATDEVVGLFAGESALADYTMLNEPRVDTIAVDSSNWTRLQKHFEDVVDEWEPGSIVVETWSYDPLVLSNDEKKVDRLSLYLSLRDHQDERVQGEVRRLIEEMPW